MGIPGIDPRHATADLFGVGIDSVTPNAGHSTAVSVFRLGGDFCCLSEAHVGERLLRLCTEGLSLLGSVYLGEPNLNLQPIVQDGQRVAVRYCNHNGNDCRC